MSNRIAIAVFLCGLLGSWSWAAGTQSFTGEIHLTFDTQGSGGDLMLLVGEKGSKVNVNVKMGQGENAGMANMVMVMRNDDKQKIFQLDEAAKAYSVLDLEQLKKMIPQEEKGKASKPYKVEKKGQEKLLGYQTTKVMLERPGEQHTLWVSKDLDIYETYRRLQDAVPGNSQQAQMMKALEQAGVEGFPVKSVSVIQGAKTVTEVKQVKERKVTDAEVSVPQGYSKKANMLDMLGKMGQGQMPSPEEMEELKRMMEAAKKNQPAK